MLEGIFLSKALGVFGTGILASLSPCVYPMIPITVGFFGTQTKNGGRTSGVLMYTLGQTLALVAIGALAVQLGETLGFSSQTPVVQVSIGVFLILAGVFSWAGRLPGFLNRMNGVSGKIANFKVNGLLAPFLLGVSAALIASPCTSPILGGVLALMAASESYFQGLTLMLLYASGFSLVFLFLGLGLVKSRRLPTAGAWMAKVHKAAAILLVVAGIYYVSLPFQGV